MDRGWALIEGTLADDTIDEDAHPCLQLSLLARASRPLPHVGLERHTQRLPGWRGR